MTDSDQDTSSPAMTPELKKRCNDLDKSAGNRLRIVRRARGVSQEALAAHLGISFQQVQKYERGSNRLSYSKIVLIMEYLKLEADFFFKDVGVEKGESDIDIMIARRMADQINRAQDHVSRAQDILTEAQSLATL